MLIYHENASDKASFTRTGDAYAVNEKLKIAAVADSPLRELLRTELRRYPQDDFGFDTASTFCESMVDLLSDRNINSESFLKALSAANQQIKFLNESLGKTKSDYLNYDLAECIGVATIQVGNKLIYGGLEDCYVNVLRGDKLKNIAPFNFSIVKASKNLDKLVKDDKYLNQFPDELKKYLPEHAYWEPIWCNLLRNNYEIKNEQNENMGWGCFTGEEAAEKFFQVHEIDLEPNDHIFVFSDGMIPFLNETDFVKWFVENVQENFDFSFKMRKKIIELSNGNDYCWKEKTLVYWKV